MTKSTSASILLLTLISAITLNDVVSEGPTELKSWFEMMSRDKPPEKITKLHFYFHDLAKGKNVTAAVVARSNVTSFGVLASADDPLTVRPELTSKRVGYLKGLYMTASFEEVDLLMAMTFVFTDETYNGSSLSVLGHNPHQHLYRELPVVGGSGRFRLARGVASLQTYFYNRTIGNAIVEVDIMVFHY
ncbi:dirigent protein 21-like [Salvia miltiorrhiza]|uniref:dirigent protein 21-like n=1 Tax=Salvia miltiorrhiza TaxID=226208 RepID=UPI0025AB9030|nr:dirigent protein 21-like [Salvia miltiorrhiza]